MMFDLCNVARKARTVSLFPNCVMKYLHNYLALHTYIINYLFNYLITYQLTDIPTYLTIYLLTAFNVTTNCLKIELINLITELINFRKLIVLFDLYTVFTYSSCNLVYSC